MKQLLLLFFSIAAFSQKLPSHSNALGESREIQLPYLLLSKKIPQKISTLILLDGITCSIRFMEHYLMAPIGMIYLKTWASAKIKITEHIEDSTYDEADNVPTEKELNSLSLLVPCFLISKKIPYCSLQNHSRTRYDSWILNFSFIKTTPFNGYISLSPEPYGKPNC
jgi:hypothetical protein